MIPGAPKAGTVVYTLPQDNAEKIRIDLNFFNHERPGLAMNQRILFSEGTVEIKEVGPNHLQMSFNGKGHPMMDRKSFPIEGSVDFSY